VTVSAEFLNTAIVSLGQINASLDPMRQADLSRVKFYAQYAPTQQQLDATGTRPDQILLGLYTSEPKPTIIIFEDSLRRISSDLFSATRDVQEHEIHQHYFGLNHILREPARVSS